MLKKLSVALAFLGDPGVIILDEPLITLDEQSRSELLKMVAEVDAKGDVVTLFSSHQSLDAVDLPIKRKFRIENKVLVAV